MLHSAVYISKAGKKGKGVFTKIPLQKNTLIEIAPVIVLSAKDRAAVEKTKLYNYIFEWGDDGAKAAVGLGFISIYNHQSPSNCEYQMDFKKETMAVKTMQDIAAGDELTINYSTGWDEWKPVWFEEIK